MSIVLLSTVGSYYAVTITLLYYFMSGQKTYSFSVIYRYFHTERLLKVGGSLSAAQLGTQLRLAPSLVYIFVYSEFGSYAKFRKDVP